MLAVGLDGVWRFTPKGPTDQPVALKGGWTSKETFVLHYREVAGVNHFEMRFAFDGEKVPIDLHDPSGYFNETITGRLSP